MAREPSEVMRLPAAATGRAAALPVLREPPTPATKTAERRSDVDAWGRSERARRFARTAFDPVYRHWFRAEWDGLDRIPTSGGALLVANHAGAVPPDAPVIMHGIESEIGRPVYGLADHLFKDTPVVGTIWNRMGGVVAHPDNAYRLLHDDEALVLVFPEGGKGPAKTIRDRYRLARFGRGGFIEIAMRAGVPIIPIAVIGAEEAMPTLVNLPWVARRLGLPYLPVTANAIAFGPAGMLTYFPAKFRLRVLEPVTFDVPPNLERYSRSRVMEASEDVRTRIQQAVFDMLRARKSVWR